MNDGAPMARAKVVVAATAPDLPVIVTLYCPTAAELLAVNISPLDPVVGFGKKDAVTPLGTPDAKRLTPPANPFSGFM